MRQLSINNQTRNKELLIKNETTFNDLFSLFLTAKKAIGVQDKTLDTYRFHFSAIRHYLNTEKMQGHTVSQADVAASFQAAVVEVLVTKTMQAAVDHHVKRVAVAGGVSANKALRQSLEAACKKHGFEFCRPEIILCTDNAAMIALCAYKKLQYAEKTGQPLRADINIDPNRKVRNWGKI